MALVGNVNLIKQPINNENCIHTAKVHNPCFFRVHVLGGTITGSTSCVGCTAKSTHNLTLGGEGLLTNNLINQSICEILDIMAVRVRGCVLCLLVGMVRY